MASKSKSRDFENEEIFVTPRCLIYSTKDGSFQVDEDVIRQIQKIDVPLVVVAIVGLYRTGKSYLMNRLAGVSLGFPLGSSVESKTKGIWAWCHRHPEIPDTVLLLLDTEGLGDVAKGDQGHDNRIFTLAALLCNVLVYNVMTALNQDVVEKLTFISELSKNIRFANKSDIYEQNDQLEMILPTFVLCIRDFSLTLEVDGKEVTADEYLEHCLQLKWGKDPATERYNRPRESLRKYFPIRKCFTFDAPGTKKTLRQLEKLRLEDLSEDFIEETNKFLAYIHQRKPKVLLTSKPVTGQMFVSLVETYVKAIRKGAVPDVDDAIMAVARIENERMAKIAVEKFKECLLHIKLPVLQAVEFDNLRQDIQTTCLAQFRLESVFDKDGQHEKAAILEMDRLWDETKTENVKLLEKHCKTVLNNIFTFVARKKQRGSYTTKGGYNVYKGDIAKTKLQYKHEVKGFDEVVASKVLLDFMEDEGQNETEILMSDQHFSEEERKREMDKLHREHLEAQKGQAEMFERRMREETERAEKHMQNLEQQRQKNNQENELKLKNLTDQWAKDREFHNHQIKEMLANNAKEREAYRREITAMQGTIKEQKKEADARIIREREDNRRREKTLQDQLIYLKTEFQTSQAEKEKQLQMLNEKAEEEKEKYMALVSQLEEIKRQGKASSDKALELERQIKKSEEGGCVIQ